jgi:spermidine/putrescine transport system substrate-binding protein
MPSARTALLAGAALILPGAAAAQETLNALVWCDHTDPALIEPFDRRTTSG